MAAFDDGLSELNAGLAIRGSFARGVDNVAYDCKLVCVNSADNSDKYYVLQVYQNLSIFVDTGMRATNTFLIV